MTDIKITKTTDLVMFDETFRIRRRDDSSSDTHFVSEIAICIDENQELILTIKDGECDISEIKCPDKQTLHLHTSTAYEIAKRIIRLCDQYDSQVDYSETSHFNCRSL